MLAPREVFENPGHYWSFLTGPKDDEVEGPHFDRKEAGKLSPDGTLSGSQVGNIVENVTECLSAFANSNKEGGLLVLGIASNGSVKGVGHLSEQHRNRITDFDSLLNHQSASPKFYECQDDGGATNKILLIYVPETKQFICETPGRNPRAWIRSGSQNVPMTQATRDRIRQQKKIVDFELTYCCDFHISDVDRDVLEAFRRVYLPDGVRDFTDEELLYEAGAIIRTPDGYGFTNAGLLFFATNPQRVLGSAYIRLLRFITTSDNIHNRGLRDLEKPFNGPLTKQIRDARTFFKESGFFKVYQKRKPDGGFAEEPEYPPIAIDEAIVNAVTHRDYATALPTECESYRDAFIVRNPGRMMQRDVDLPDEFSLADRILNSKPGNPKLIEWLKIMRDPDGKAFVQAISEGTKTITKEMSALDLPVPSYRLSDNETALKLVSNAEAREAALLASTRANTTEFTNLYPLNILQGSTPVNAHAFQMRYKEFLTTFRDILLARDWHIDRFSFSRVIAHRRGASLDLPKSVSSILRFYPAYIFQARQYLNHYYLCINYTVQVLNVLHLNRLLPHFSVKDFVDSRCIVKQDSWKEGKIITCEEEWAKVSLFDSGQEVQAPSSSVIPYCSSRMLESLLKKLDITFDLHQAIKQHSLAAQQGAARIRAEKIASMAEYAAESLFPVVFGDFVVSLDPHPVQLVEHSITSKTALPVRRLAEPIVEFRDHHALTDVRDGITRFGAYENTPHTVELVPICLDPHRQDMEYLIERLKVGKYKYRGAERTFATRFTYTSIVTVRCVEDIQKETKRMLTEHRDWIGNTSLSRIFLVHTPEQGYATDDESSPYYVVKRLLLENGIPCQMVDTPTLDNPDWKDLNLALNITAKCGVIPWVLPDAIPDADFFIGLSYTQSRNKRRVMGFANVFNRYGRWQFYSGNTASFDYDERTEKLAHLVRETLRNLTLSSTPNIIFHYSAKFSREDRAAILEAARSIRPQGIYTFVWVNSDHNVYIFDSRAETDGSMRRGSYVQTSPHEIFLSTTGYTSFRRAMGTPKPIQITAWVYRPEGVPSPPPDMKALAVQVLSLTKLNWASTDAFCGEPITLKYAGDIAYLTDAFMRQSEQFNLHPVLERTPWFL